MINWKALGGRLDGIREGASLKHADRFVLNKRQIGEEGREGSQLRRVEGMALEEGHEGEGRFVGDCKSYFSTATSDLALRPPPPLPSSPAHSHPVSPSPIHASL